MFDIHCHILPAVDDGSGGINDSIEMARLAQASGVKSVVATPHTDFPGSKANHWCDEMQATINELNEKLWEQKINVTVHPGQEVFLSSDSVKRLREGKLIGLNRSRYMLVEFDADEAARTAYRKLWQISAEGYTPVLAHPERYGFVQEDPGAVLTLKENGCLLQVNKGSLKGRFGHHVLSTAHKIISSRAADFVASDAHSQYQRTPFLAEIHEMISEHYSEYYADLLLRVNPSRAIDNKDIFKDS